MSATEDKLRPAERVANIVDSQWESSWGDAALEDEATAHVGMIDYGAPPAADEIEVTLFGPGYGEAIAVHLGEGDWLLVDSCIDPISNVPASATYLEKIGVNAEQVQSIVASHWHEDHVSGISQLATTYSIAEFVISAAFNDKEALAFLAAYSGALTSRLSRGTTELNRAIRERDKVVFVLHRSNVLEATLNATQVKVTALSPVPAAFAQFIAHVAEYKARKDGAINPHQAQLDQTRTDYQDQIKALTEAVAAIPKQTDIPNARARIKEALEKAAQGNTAFAEAIFIEV